MRTRDHPASGAAGSPAAAVAAGSPAAAVLRRPVQAGTVTAVFGSAVLIEVPGAPGDRHLGLLGPDATGVPNGVRMPGSFDGAGLSTLRPGDVAVVGDGRLRLGRVHLRLAREWPTRVRAQAVAAQRCAVLTAALAGVATGVPPPRVSALAAAVRAGDPAALAASAAGLVGVGAGLTPGGDDVLAGTLVGLHATGRSVLAAVLGRACHPLLPTTTAISAELVVLASRGDACLEVLAVLRALRAGSPDTLAAALAALLSVGHTSGADLAVGLATGLAGPATPDGGFSRRTASGR